MKAGRLLSLGIACTLLATLSVAAGAAPQAGPCAPGTAYDPACDVDHNGAIDVTDIQLTAGHWGQTGTYNIYPAMVPITGQVVSYAVGDDGDLERGVPWPDPRFTDNGNGTVTDNLTGLIWLKNVNCFAGGTWTNSLNQANTLNSGECGLTDGSVEGDWRLPNLREMQSLINYQQYGPALPVGHPFFTIVASAYWTSTTYSIDTSQAWHVSLNSGIVRSDSKGQPWYVWPVRGG